MSVHLEPIEIEVAELVGRLRHERAEARGWKAQFVNGTTIDAHTKGAFGEIVVAKALGVYWSGLRELAEGDVGGYHVRFSAERVPRLWIRPREHPEPEWRYVLVTGEPAYFEIIGGMTAGEAMSTREPTNPSPSLGPEAWVVERDELHPIIGAAGGRFQINRRGAIVLDYTRENEADRDVSDLKAD